VYRKCYCPSGEEVRSGSQSVSLVNFTSEKREIEPFCILSPALRKPVSSFKVRKTQDLSLLANKVHHRQGRGGEMNNEFSVKTAVCTEHQRLLAECQRALEVWNERRAEFCLSRSNVKEAGDELLRLQAKYARAYTVLQSHARNCSLCQLASREGRRDSEDRSDAHSDSRIYV